ncbi:major facilitator superfamily MFS_1 [Rhizorhabdus wittichii RW1]|uniref:Major facilitator superfamily MFS_1 n=2 Tax=Rhizorhabdus wittichii TaxID=160791 RepID=A0A9J9HAG8_RHIWR|nr:MFS transporter [Rhizorhabdus wittichii]ABQ68040.1 major facilitator superfamily MFS_1 [Rhizorhabdus wittichii RW1]QTH21527.1 MFS transporter [Rhizorhabdus wittichii]
MLLHPDSRRAAPTGTAPWREWWLVGVLTVASMLAYIDKNIVSLMVVSIQKDLGLRPAQVTLALGTAFAIANILISIPAGWLADRVQRRSIVAVAILLWSAMAIACGNVTGFVTLLLARAGVGLAEGLLPPACYSMIGDGVSPQRRARALGVFSMSNLVGTGLAFLGGGLLLGLLGRVDYSGLPLVGHLPPWGLALVITGALGFPLLLLVFLFREPKRHEAAGDQAAASPEPPSWSEVLRALAARRGMLVPLAIFSVAHAMLTNSVNLWIAPLLMGRFGLTPAQIGTLSGALLLTAGPIGLFVAGAVIDRLNRQGRHGAQLIALVVAAIMLPCAIFHGLAATQASFWFWQALLLLVATTYLLVTSSIVTRELPPAMVGRAIAIFLLLQGLLGVGLAPTLTALAIETVFAGDAQPIGHAMATMHGAYAAVALVAAIVMFRRGRALR